MVFVLGIKWVERRMFLYLHLLLPHYGNLACYCMITWSVWAAVCMHKLYDDDIFCASIPFVNGNRNDGRKPQYIVAIVAAPRHTFHEKS